MKPSQNDPGRSMIEMLGVLAVIGVLSFGGIQGYTYAMHKYRTNTVLNEINTVSHQLTTELITSRNAQKILSLGNPYNDGVMNAENYPFDYGCGNNKSEERSCHQTENGYWISVGGLTKKICQNMLTEAVFLPYFVAQKLNGENVTKETICAEENNEITFLFNSDESGNLATNAGSENGDNKEEPAPTEICPVSTSTDGQGGLATTLTDTETGNVTQCYCVEKGTKYNETSTKCEILPDTCKKNTDCNRGEYCEITNYGSDYCTKNTNGMKGSCRKASGDVKTPKSGSNPPFVLSNKQMYWWSAVNFCKALGKTLVEVTDYECAHTICPSGCSAKTGYCHANTSISVATNNTSNISENVKAMKIAYGSSYNWMNTDYTSCNAYVVYTYNGYVINNLRYDRRFAACK